MDIDSDNAFPRTKIGRDHQMRDGFRHGMVIDRKKDEKRGALCRVQYLDKQGTVSQWFPVKQFGSRKTQHFYCPKVGEYVNVNMLCNGSEDGFIDGTFYNGSNPPPEGVDIDTRHFRAEDQTVIEYRELDHCFNLNDPSGPVRVQATDIHIIATVGIVEIISPVMISLTAPIIQINGFIQHTGDMVTSGVHTDANGIHGAFRRDAELEALKERVRLLEERVNAIENSGP